jgi:hypothetical protein
MRLIVLLLLAAGCAALEAVDLPKHFGKPVPFRTSNPVTAARPTAWATQHSLCVLATGETYDLNTPGYEIREIIEGEDGLVILKTFKKYNAHRGEEGPRTIYWIRLADGINMLCIEGKWEVYVDPVKLAAWPVPEEPGD